MSERTTPWEELECVKAARAKMAADRATLLHAAELLELYAWRQEQPQQAPDVRRHADDLRATAKRLRELAG